MAALPYGYPLLLSPLSHLPDRVAAISYSEEATKWTTIGLPPQVARWEAARLRRYRLEADKVRLKGTLKAMKECAKDQVCNTVDSKPRSE